MKLKRIITSVSAQFDEFVSKIENHEAIAESAIKQARQQTAKIHSQLKSMERRLNQLEQHHAALSDKAVLWKQRAVASENEHDDREKALQCMQALKNTQNEAAQVLQQIQSLTQLKADLQAHLQASEQQLNELSYRKESLMARTAKNNIKKLAESDDESDIGNVFERWEQNIAADEYIVSTNADSEFAFESEFVQQEAKLDLELSLEQLLDEHTRLDKERNNG